MYFIADYLPPDRRKYFALNPLLHGVSWFRSAFWPTYPKMIDNHAYILWASLIAITLGLLIERQFRRFMSGDE
jgi:capsular polysaccharide transport system permease protein